MRGTVFFADATAKDKTFICACKGKTHIAGSALGAAGHAPAFDKEVDGHDWEHRAVAFIKKGKKVEVKEFPPGKPPSHTAEQADQILRVLRSQP